MTYRQAVSYGLIAGISLGDLNRMQPGLVLDLFVYRRQYDDTQHRIVRKQERIYD